MLTPLAQDHAFFRQDPAPVYWALAPHLVSQHTDSACALASASMVLNALRSLNGHHRIGDVISEQSLLEAMNDEHWHAAFRAGTGDGLKLARYGEDMPRALSLFGLQDRWSVSIQRMASGDVAAAAQFRDDLIGMQREADRLLIANFHLGTFYGDGVDIGHYSPLGAYDERQDRLLLLDVYKPSYEPAWAPVDHLARAMSILDNTELPRGYLLLTRQPVVLV